MVEDKLFPLVEAGLKGRTYEGLFIEAVNMLIEKEWWEDNPKPHEHPEYQLKKIPSIWDEPKEEYHKSDAQKAGVVSEAAAVAGLFGLYKLTKYLYSKFTKAKTPKVKDKLDQTKEKIVKIKAKKKK